MQGETVEFEALTQHPPQGFMPLGAYSYSQTYLRHLARMGRYCSVGTGIHIMGLAHPTDWVSSNPLFYNKGRYRRFAGEPAPYDRSFREQPAPITVGNDVWIGDNAVLKGGITIHDGAVVGYGAVVTKDVPPYAIVAGVPAKIIRYRFPEGILKEMQDRQWWRFELQALANLPHEDPAAFLAAFDSALPHLRELEEDRRKVADFLETSESGVAESTEPPAPAD